MGLPNNQNYTPTVHYLERMSERFNIKTNLESMNFFKQQVDTLEYAGKNTTKLGVCEVWANDKVTFILDVQNKRIVTVYKTGSIEIQVDDAPVEKSEQSFENPLSLFGNEQINNIIFDELFGNVEQTFEKISNLTCKITILHEKMQKTSRKDYKAKQMDEAHEIMYELARQIKSCSQKENEINKFKERLG